MLYEVITVFDTFEFGFKHRFNSAFNYSIIAYRTKISDKIVYYYVGTDVKGYYNGGDSIHQGIELEVDGRPVKLIGYRIGFTTIDAEWEKGQLKDIV